MELSKPNYQPTKCVRREIYYKATETIVEIAVFRKVLEKDYVRLLYKLDIYNI